MGQQLPLLLIGDPILPPSAPMPTKRKGRAAPPGSGAVFSPCGRYRYELTRPLVDPLPAEPKVVVMVGLNPSSAGADQNDQTIDQCSFFARREGGDLLVMLNTYAFIATQPEAMWAAGEDAVGPDNDMTIQRWVEQARRVIACWGGLPKPAFRRVLAVTGMLRGTRFAVTVRHDGAPAPSARFGPYASRAEAKAAEQNRAEILGASVEVTVLPEHAREIYCLGLTAEGFPRHPSRMAHATPLVLFPPKLDKIPIAR